MLFHIIRKYTAPSGTYFNAHEVSLRLQENLKTLRGAYLILRQNQLRIPKVNRAALAAIPLCRAMERLFISGLSYVTAM